MWLWLAGNMLARSNQSTVENFKIVSYLTALHNPYMHTRVKWTNKRLDDWNPTSNKSCLMVGTQKIVKTFSKVLLSSALYRGPKFKKIRFFLEKCLFYCSNFFYMQLLDCHAIYHWKELFTEENDILFVKICFYLVKLLPFKHSPYFATCREDKNR